MTPLIAWAGTEEIPCVAYLPPLRVTQRVHVCKSCWTAWRPLLGDVRRWEIEGKVLWVADCPSCRSQQTLHVQEVAR